MYDMGEGGTRSRAIRFYKELVSLRKQLSKIISEGSTQWLIVNDREDKLYFTRKLEDRSSMFTLISQRTLGSRTGK